MPEVPQVKTCCFCCSTEIGSKIIGWWLLISGILSGITWVLYLIRSVGNHQSGSTTNAVIEIIFSLLVIFMGYYLLHGTYKRNMRYVKNWITIATVYLIIIAIGTVVLLIQGHVDVLSQIVNFLLVAYFIVVVYSYYKENVNAPPTTY